MALQDLFPGKLGFGTAPLGNMFRDIPEAEARATVDAAWNDGIRYFDNAPLYGAGLAEIRIGEALAGRPRDEYVISTKVGRLILDEVEDVNARDLGEKGEVFKHGRPNKIVNDYSADATLRSIEDSLKRLKTDRIEIVWVHDVRRISTATNGWASSRTHARARSERSTACATRASSRPGVWASTGWRPSNCCWAWKNRAPMVSCSPAATRCSTTTVRCSA